MIGSASGGGAGSIPLSGSSYCYYKVNEHPGHLTHGHIRKMYVVRGNYVETLRKSLDSLIVVINESLPELRQSGDEETLAECLSMLSVDAEGVQKAEL